MVAVLGGATPSQLLPREQQQQLPVCRGGGGAGVSCPSVWAADGVHGSRPRRRAAVKAAAFWQRSPMPPPADVPMEMEPICDSEQLDRILQMCQGEEEPHSIVIDWMAAWCRKCIYLKPKLEKLAMEFHPKVKFYSVDVNKVPQALVKRGNISLWKDGKMKAEIIGGHKAWLVVEEVREMIQKNI